MIHSLALSIAVSRKEDKKGSKHHLMIKSSVSQQLSLFHAQNIPFTDAVRLQLYKMANSPKTVPPFISPNASPSFVTSRRPSEKKKDHLIITRTQTAFCMFTLGCR